jgi:hypothetical protein
MRGLGVSVFRTADIGDCTNGGVTSRVESCILFDIEDGYWSATDPNLPADKLLLLKRDKVHLGGYLYAVPGVVDPDSGEVVPKSPPDGHVGWMMGGNLVGTSDSRFSVGVTSLGAIPVHDRSESYELYRALSSD